MRGRDGREGPLHPQHPGGARRPARARREGDRADQPPRLGSAPDLPRLWLGGRSAPSCDVSLVVHRAGEGLRCHHCGYGRPLPRACPDCGSVTLARAGAGSQRIEDEIAAAVAPLEVFRLDADSSAGRRRPPRDPAGLPGGGRGGPGRDPDGRQGARLPRRRPRRRRRRRLDPALSRPASGGAHLRARRPARRPQRPRRAGGPGPGADPDPGGGGDRASGPPRRGGLSRR